MASDKNQTTERQETEEEQAAREKRVSDMLGDEATRSLLIEKLKESGHVGKDIAPTSRPIQNPNSGGPWPTFPPQYTFAPFPASSFWGPVPPSPWGMTPSNPQTFPGSAWMSGQPGSSCTQDQEVEGDDNEEDVIHLLDDAEALELVQYDPSVQDETAWEANETINAFLEKHFLQPLASDERDRIKKDFPKPASPALLVPKLDEEIKEQIKKTGKNPHFGSEKFLFKFQEQLLEIAGPLTCLWTDMLDQKATVKQEDILLLLQRVLILLGGASHTITQERRRIAWGRVNPANTLPEDAEEGKEKQPTLFGGGFLERAAKRIEKTKELEKVTGSRQSGAPPQKKRKYQDKDPKDLRRFLERGAPTRYGGGNYTRPKPFYQQPRKFQTQKRGNKKPNN